MPINVHQPGHYGEVSTVISALTLEVLHSPLMSFCGFAGSERPKVSTPASFVIFLTGVQTVLARAQLSDHRNSPVSVKFYVLGAEQQLNQCIDRSMSVAPVPPAKNCCKTP
jgi:hypothetical protein